MIKIIVLTTLALLVVGAIYAFRTTFPDLSIWARNLFGVGGALAFMVWLLKSEPPTASHHRRARESWDDDYHDR